MKKKRRRKKKEDEEEVSKKATEIEKNVNIKRHSNGAKSHGNQTAFLGFVLYP